MNNLSVKKILLIYSLFVITTNAHAQFCAKSYDSKDFTQFKSSKTYAVKTGDKKFDTELESALKEYWQITSYTLINEVQVEDMISDESASFLLPLKVSTTDGKGFYHFYALINGGKKKLDKYLYNDLVAYALINRWGNESTPNLCAPRLRNMIASMVTAIKIVEDEKIKAASTFGILNELTKYYSKQSSKIKSRTLLINKDACGQKFDENDFTQAYPFKYEFCPQDKITKAIASKDTNYYYLQPAISANKMILVFDPATGEVVYAGYQAMSMSTSVNKKNIEELAKAIGN